MADPVYALVAAFIWAVSPIYYRGFLADFDALSFNFFRTSTGALVLLVPAIYYWGLPGIGFAALSGVTALACGDTLFLLSIREAGASVAAPVVYTYVLMVQVVGAAFGQAIPYTNFAASLMVVAGVYVLSKGGGGNPRGKGIAFALAAALFWTVGQGFVQLSTSAGGSVVEVTFMRDASAAAALGLAFLLARGRRRITHGLGLRGYGVMAAVTVSDLVAGSALFVYSVSTLGVALTVILTSLSPALTQTLARALGKESPSGRDLAGGALIVAALILAVAI